MQQCFQCSKTESYSTSLHGWSRSGMELIYKNSIYSTLFLKTTVFVCGVAFRDVVDFGDVVAHLCMVWLFDIGWFLDMRRLLEMW